MRDKYPPRKHTGGHISPQKKARILALLCAGHSINQVARETHSQWLTVRAVQWANQTTVEERKRILAERSENAAADALDLLHNKIRTEAKKIQTNALVPIFGVLIDKSLALRADPTIHIEHSHQHIHAHITERTYSELMANLPRRTPLSSGTPDGRIQEPLTQLTEITDVEAHKIKAEDTPA